MTGVWHPSVMFSLMEETAAARLVVTVGAIPGEDMWSVIALETPAKHLDAEAILGDHAHESLGEFSLERAMKRGKSYATLWRMKQKKLGHCPCGPITVLPASPQPRTPRRSAKVRTCPVCGRLADAKHLRACEKKRAMRAAWIRREKNLGRGGKEKASRP